LLENTDVAFVQSGVQKYVDIALQFFGNIADLEDDELPLNKKARDLLHSFFVKITDSHPLEGLKGLGDKIYSNRREEHALRQYYNLLFSVLLNCNISSSEFEEIFLQYKDDLGSFHQKFTNNEKISINTTDSAIFEALFDSNIINQLLVILLDDMESLNIQSPSRKQASKNYSNPRALRVSIGFNQYLEQQRAKLALGKRVIAKANPETTKLHKKFLLTLTHIPYIHFKIIKEKRFHSCFEKNNYLFSEGGRKFIITYYKLSLVKIHYSLFIIHSFILYSIFIFYFIDFH
jgi:hypothetical protein